MGVVPCTIRSLRQGIPSPTDIGTHIDVLMALNICLVGDIVILKGCPTAGNSIWLTKESFKKKPIFKAEPAENNCIGAPLCAAMDMRAVDCKGVPDDLVLMQLATIRQTMLFRIFD